jgi:hypothetical protein
VKTFLIFGKMVISLSDFGDDVPSHDPFPDPECLAANTFFLREFCQNEWSLSATFSMFRLQEAEAARRSLVVVA